MRLSAIGVAVTALLLATAPANASFFLDFENGSDGNPVADIAGVSFQDFNGFDAIYADARTGAYNATSDDMAQTWGSGNWHHNGWFSVWAGPQATAQGMIVDFTENDGTWFTTGYSSASAFTVEVWHTDGTHVDFVGAANTTPTGNPFSGQMGYINAFADAGKAIDYLVLHDTGNFWIVDDMSGDASRVGEPVPEPATLLLVGGGLLGMAARRRKRK